jgi:hypothetical protein
MGITVLSLAAMLTPGVSAQNGPVPSRLEGTIVNAITGAPVRKAHVILQPAKQGEPIIVATDAEGKYAITVEQPGSWRLQAARDGFATQVYGAKKPGERQKGDVLDLPQGTVKTKLDFALTPLGSMMGRVVDDNGDPVRGVQIAVMFFEHGAAGRTLQTRSLGITDALGEYRVFDLPPEKYYLRAKPPSVQMPANVLQGETYALVYYPNAPQPSGATPITLTPGQDQRGLDFVLRTVATARLEGRIIKPPGATTCTVSLEDADAGPEAILGSAMFTMPGNITVIGNATFSESSIIDTAALHHMIGEEGKFDFRNLPVGTHTVMALCQAENQQYWVRNTVQLGTQGIANLELRPVSPSLVTVKVRVEGATKDDKPEIHVYLESADGQIGSNDPGGLVFSGVGPRVYQVRIEAPAELYTKSVTWNQQDVLETGLDLTPGGMGVDLEVVLSANGGTVEGSVENGAGTVVTLVPSDPQRAKDAKSMTAEDSHFSFKAVPPGRYKVFAWEDADVNQAMYDAEFRRPYDAQGESVDLAENQKATVQLKAIPRAANQ